MQLDRWDRCTERLSDNALYGRKCFFGLDLASREDIAGYAIVFPPTEDDKRWAVKWRFFLPENMAVKRQKQNAVPYQQWANDGYITLTSGDRCDYQIIRNHIIEDAEKFGLIDIGADKWNLEYLRQELDLEGIEVVEYSQSYAAMSEPIKTLKALINSGDIRLDNNPVARWMASNVVVELDNQENIRFSKKKSSEKIDGMVMLAMGIGRGIQYEGIDNPYEERGIVII